MKAPNRSAVPVPPASASVIEMLEARIAPASVSVTFVDVDGDTVKITATKGPLDAADLTFVGGGTSGQLSRLDITAAEFSGAKITFSVKKAAGGDGLAHVGWLDATGNDLLGVTVKGDLGKITAGSPAAGGTSVGSLTVDSFGGSGLTSQGGAGDLNSVLTGDLGSLKIAKDFTDAFLRVNSGGIKSIKIGGSVVGGIGNNTGLISSATDIGTIAVGRNIVGGDGANSGGILTDGGIAKASVGGTIKGGTGAKSGGIGADNDILSVTVKEDILGGSGAQSGGIASSATLLYAKVGGSIFGGEGNQSGGLGAFRFGKVMLSGNLHGGAGPNSGGIVAFSDVGTVKVSGSVYGGSGETSGTVFGNTLASIQIGGDITGGSGNNSGGIGATTLVNALIKGSVIGGSITGTASLENSGGILAGDIQDLTINGSVVAGVDASTGELSRSGGVVAIRAIGKLTIKGGLVGNATHSVTISASGLTPVPTEGDDLAIGTLTIGREVIYANILAGYNESGLPTNADASIGKITVGGNWKASSALAGVIAVGDDFALQGVSNNAAQVAKIVSIQIKGSVTGTAAGSDDFAFAAQEIVSLKIGKLSIPLQAGASNDSLTSPYADDVKFVEAGILM